MPTGVWLRGSGVFVRRNIMRAPCLRAPAYATLPPLPATMPHMPLLRQHTALSLLSLNLLQADPLLKTLGVGWRLYGMLV